MTRFQVFTSKHNDAKPVFAAPWKRAAQSYADFFCINSDYCRIDDKKMSKSILEWARATKSQPVDDAYIESQIARWRRGENEAREEESVFGTGNVQVIEPELGHKIVVGTVATCKSHT